jgi:glycosyltransferase involved in cell wall biosynthesis/GT2 family glycosyltransferase
VLAPLISVVIPTKDRPDLLRRCLRAVLDQQTDVRFEVIVVNDAGCEVDSVVESDPRLTFVRAQGRGPATARNAGIARAAGEIVLFTDDDAVPQPGWLQAAAAALERSPNVLGVVGRVESPPFDPLYEHSVAGDSLGNFLTCNVAYRLAVLKQLGGFDTGFPYPAAEDRDLGYRAQEIGDLVYEPEMIVLHPPRPVRVREVARHGRFVRSEWRLHHRHPQTRPPRWSLRWGPFIRLARGWQRLLSDASVIRGSPTRALRFILLASAQLLVALEVTLRGSPFAPDRSPVDLTGEKRRVRLAWIGAEPQRGGGVSGCAWLLLQALSQQGCDLDCYAGGPHDELRERLSHLPGVRLINVDTGWRYNRWYSSHNITKLLTGLGCRVWERRSLSRLLLAQHRRHAYDAVYQFSTIEIFGMRRHLDELPPLIIHPETHMAGELRWVRRERDLAARCEPLLRRALVEGFLAARVRRQRRDLNLASRVAIISQEFGKQLSRDYGIDPERLTLIRNPIDLDELRPVSRPQRAGPWRIVFVSRMSARKGVELVVDLSHRLADLEDEVTIELIGDRTLWSDYRPLLAGLDPRIARYRGPMVRRELAAFLAESDLLLQPAKYEPFGLTVGEALALGVPVVATDAVGAAEEVSSDCCTVVPAGDIGALEDGVRSMLDRLRQGHGPVIACCARAEAERLFSPETLATTVLEIVAAAQEQDRGRAALMQVVAGRSEGDGGS